MDGRHESGTHGSRALNEALFGKDVHHGQTCCASRRVGRVGVAVEELHAGLGATVDDGVVDRLLGGHRAHGLSAVGQRFGHGHDVRRDTKGLRGKGCAHAAPAGDDFVEHQEDAVLVANGAQLVQVALGGWQATDGPCRGFNKHGSDVFAAVKSAKTLQVVGQIGAVFWLA